MIEKTLKRRVKDEPEVTDPFESARDDLLSEARTVLLYTPSNGHLEKKERADRQRGLAVLSDAGVVPFDLRSVEKYKKRRERIANLKHEWRNYLNKRGWLTTVLLVFAVSLIVFGIQATCCATENIEFRETLYTPIEPVEAVLLSLGFSVPIIVVLVAAACHFSGSAAHYKWHSTILKKYYKPIPDYAIQTALDITRSAEKCGLEEKPSLHVEEMIEKVNHNITRLDFDPFLVVRICGVDYYVEVWNEPKFNQKRSV